ncbi:hypothetical protein H310_14317 [Aphanomyces invadans]|uniref:Uncharacterized protein n=1 Tax=Aphanomyces invadans TaxID=157072 RepID=A0A024TA20_9STRA|nr:hypothetical protein H310_14317 [Aphanomyces invadans]ETV90980.1 hypothetical protein H310_14317 [Aphanomyces invadans]|eukprot:XP_008880369.1 hypothetical protein H310_14317 [Aphanomyces invadans]
MALHEVSAARRRTNSMSLDESSPHRPLALPPIDHDLFEEEMWSNIFADDDDGIASADGRRAGDDSNLAHAEWHHLNRDDDEVSENDAPESPWAVSATEHHRPSHILDILDQRDQYALQPSFDASAHRIPFVVLPVATTALSKPLCRFDGLVVVGMEDPHEKNRLVLTNFRATASMVATSAASLPLANTVRDLQWVNATIVAAAIGKDIQLVQVPPAGDGTVGCLMGGPITMAHSDAIREMAMPPPGVGRDGCILSGGFDETVCVTDLDKEDVVLKFDARNVVSSVRWMPGESNHVSWTTDGGMFSLADLRVRSSTGQIHFESPLAFGHSGGLFSHDYLSPTTVVLGYESGHVACMDLRRPTKEACYAVYKTPLAAVGDVRKLPSSTAEVALFGASGLALANFDATIPDSNEWRISFSSKTRKGCTTSGDIALGDSNLMAVSDSLGMVSVFYVPTFAAHAPCSSSLHPFETAESPRAMSF